MTQAADPTAGEGSNRIVTVPDPGTTAAFRPNRPVAVTVVGLLALAVGVYYAVEGTLTLWDGVDRDRLADGVPLLVLSLAAVVIGVGTLLMRGWAWAALMTWAAIGLTLEILRHFFYDDANYAAMAISTFMVFALTPFDVQVAFGVRPPANVKRPRPPRNPLERD